MYVQEHEHRVQSVICGVDHDIERYDYPRLCLQVQFVDNFSIDNVTHQSIWQQQLVWYVQNIEREDTHVLNAGLR